MMCADETARFSADIRRLFAGMDVTDEGRAILAMKEVAALLRQLGLSFRQVVQEIEARGLLLPTKIGTVVQLMDSDTLCEAESALSAARRLMKSSGLTFERIIVAFEHGPAGEIEHLRHTRQATIDEIEQLRVAHQAAVAKAQKMKADLRVNNFFVSATLLVCLWLSSTILSLRPESAEALLPPVAAVQEHSIPAAPPLEAQEHDISSALRDGEPPAAPHDPPDRVPPPRPRPPDRDRLARRASPDYGDHHTWRLRDPLKLRQFEWPIQSN